MSIDVLELIAAIAVVATLTLPRFLARRIKHGEARFDSKTGKLIDDE